jgi:hypothetical protein
MTIVISGIAKMFVGELVEIGMYALKKSRKKLALSEFFSPCGVCWFLHLLLLMMVFYNFDHVLSGPFLFLAHFSVLRSWCAFWPACNLPLESLQIVV